MRLFSNDEILGEKPDNIEKIIQKIIKIQNEDNMLSEKAALDVSELIKNIRNNPYLLKFIEQKYLEELGTWIVQNASRILQETPKKVQRDENGNLLLDENYFLNREHHGQGKMANKWYIIDNKEFLLKNLFKENYPETTITAEEIARQLDLKVARYFPAKENGEKKILTLNFLDNDEELIEGNIICDKQMDIAKVEEILKDFLYRNKEKPENTARILSDYRKFILYSILINHRDAHNGNWGLIKNEKGRYSFAPIYDLEGALSENIYKIRAFSYNGEYDDVPILRYLLNNNDTLDFAKSFMNLNMDEVHKSIYTHKRIKVSEELRNKNNRVIDEQKALIQRIIQEKEYEKQNSKIQEKS